ncbi:MAG: arylsulfatase [Verrucomicrobiales bacterium]|nr:arylsulfatase [Verrucomicrobiales bacterium]
MHRIAVASVFLLVALPARGAEPPPNVILFMADDMGMGDTSAYQDITGNADDVQIATPGMEKLAGMGVRFTDAHSTSTRCTATRYGLITGRYPFRNRLKQFVLFGNQGDPMIEEGRPTLATLFRDSGYTTGLVGKWHVGLRYRNHHGLPAAAFEDAHFSMPMHTTPLDHGFDMAKFTSRSHGTSGPGGRRKNGPEQKAGPGHIDGRKIVGATGKGRELFSEGPNAYVLTELGGRHSDNAIAFLDEANTAKKPFFLYYPSNSNHGPYTPDTDIDGKPVAGAARTKSGDPMDARHDFIYENDVALGRLIDYLEATDDPRREGAKLIENSIVIFTADNGAEIQSKVATGPFRSNKGSVYEGGHRVAFLVAWPKGGLKPGTTNHTLTGHQDLFATFAEILGKPLPDLQAGEKGAEDSFSVLAAWRGEEMTWRPPVFFNDHKEAKQDPAAMAIRADDITHSGKKFEGKWKLFFNANLGRFGKAEPGELYDLATDPKEENNRIEEADLQPVVVALTELAEEHRNACGHRFTDFVPAKRITLDFVNDADLRSKFEGKSGPLKLEIGGGAATMTMSGLGPKQGAPPRAFSFNPRGMGITGGQVEQVDSGEEFHFSFDKDVLIESAAIVAGNGVTGGNYRVGDHKPLAIYCVDGDNDSKEQHGILSDIGVLKAGQKLILDSSPHLGVEAKGRWRLQGLTLRVLD